ncbi:MAG TPA: lysophospholipid acyltransferase family protein [Bryobacteraceae bacterium]
MAQKKSGAQLWAEYILAYSLVAGLRFLPRSMAEKVAFGAAKLLDKAVPRLRRIARQNLAMALPELNTAKCEHIVDGTFRSIGRLLLAIARFPSLHVSNLGQWIAYEGLEHYAAAKQKGCGILVATAHLGNWELSAFAHALLTEPMHVMVRPLDNRLIDRLVAERRMLSGNRLIFKRDAARAVLKALRNNEAVGILIDQNTSESEGVFVDFFGKQACAGSGFVKLAYRSQAPVVPGFALWDEQRKRYVLRFFPAIELTGDEQADTQRIHSFLERTIRQYPDQWMWIHRRWKTRPSGEAPLY